MAEKIVDYLKDFQDPAGKRKRRRLPVKLPLLYGFASASGCDFRQALSVDISSGGIQVEVLDPKPDLAENLKKHDSLVAMKFDMPRRKGLLEAAGKICWTHEIKAMDHIRLRVGIEFLPISLNGQIELMTHALLVARRRMWGKIGVTAGIGLLLIALISTAAIFVSRKVIQSDSNASQRILQKMENKVRELASQKMELEQQIEKMKQKPGR